MTNNSGKPSLNGEIPQAGAYKTVKEDGKTFLVVGETYMRMHDENWDGKRTTYRRCRICKRLVARQYQLAHQLINHNGKKAF